MDKEITGSYKPAMFVQQNYYDKQRALLAGQSYVEPFDKHDFEYSLENWGTYCDTHRELQRSHYKGTMQPVTAEQLRQEASLQGTLTRADGGKTEIILWKGSIERLEINAIANAANETLLGGGGVDQAIHEAAGPMLVKECAHIKGGCEVGEAKITKGYQLPASYVLHTVGPILDDDYKPNDAALRSCYQACLSLCEKHHLNSVAFPCISTGFYGFPIDRSAKVAVQVIKEQVERHLHHVNLIVFAVFNEKQENFYKNELTKLLNIGK